MGRIDIRTAACGSQDVFRKWWNPPCRSCLLASAASSDFHNSVASAMRSGLVSTSMPRFLKAGGLLHGKISGQNLTVWNARACCCFQTAKWSTELQIWVHPSFKAQPSTLPPTLFHFKSSTELCRASCDGRHLVKLFPKHDITTSQREGEGGVQGIDQRTRHFRTDANDQRCALGRQLCKLLVNSDAQRT